MLVATVAAMVTVANVVAMVTVANVVAMVTVATVATWVPLLKLMPTSSSLAGSLSHLSMEGIGRDDDDNENDDDDDDNDAQIHVPVSLSTNWQTWFFPPHHIVHNLIQKAQKNELPGKPGCCSSLSVSQRPKE